MIYIYALVGCNKNKKKTLKYKWGVCNIKHLFNHLNAKLNPICHLLALLVAHHILHISRIRVKVKTHGTYSHHYTSEFQWTVAQRFSGSPYNNHVLPFMLSLFENGKVVSKYKGNGKDAPVHAMKAYRESKGTALLMLNLSTRWRWVANFIPRPALSSDSCQYQPHSWMGGWVDQRNSLNAMEDEKLSCGLSEMEPISSVHQSPARFDSRWVM